MVIKMTEITVKDINNQIDGIKTETIEISNCDSIWDEANEEITVSLDTEEFMEGDSSVKIEVNPEYTGLLASVPLNNLELDMIDQVKIRIKSTIPLGSGDLQLLLSENPGCLDPLETLNLMGISENIWVLSKLSVTNPKDLLEVMSCGLKLTTTHEAFTIHVDIVKGYNSDYTIKSSKIQGYINDAKREVAGYLDLDGSSSLDMDNDIIYGAIILWTSGLVWNHIYDEASQDREGWNRGPYLIRQAKDMLKQFINEDSDKTAIPTAVYHIDSYYE
jgi:uncharacterized alkaline shock family protein YloU